MSFSFLIFSYALLLILDGVIFQILAEHKDIAVLQPAFFGGLTLLMGIMTLKEDLRIFGRHGAAALSVIAFASSVVYFVEWLENPVNAGYLNYSNSIMTLLSLIFLIIAVRMFARERNLK